MDISDLGKALLGINSMSFHYIPKSETLGVLLAQLSVFSINSPQIINRGKRRFMPYAQNFHNIVSADF